MRHWMVRALAVCALIGLVQPLTLRSAGAQAPPGPPKPGPRAVEGSDSETSRRAEVDLLLILAVDISRSVDERKFRLQREGYAAALTNPRVIKAIGAGLTGRIAISFIEWSGVGEQTIVADWTSIAGEADARNFAQRILTAPRAFLGRTAIGSAIEFALLQFPRSPWTASRHLIDVSGDGTSNSGTDLDAARALALSQGITVNGLAILSDVPLPFNPQHTHPPGGLLHYYQTAVVGGPNAFAIAANGHDAFGDAILAKLIKEIALAD